MKRTELSPKICIFCGKGFSIKPKEKPFKFLKRETCSRQCNGPYVAKKYCTGKKAHNNNRQERGCKYCHKTELVSPVHAKRPFCSRKCMALYYSENNHGENSSHWEGGKIERNCIVCGEPFKFDKGDLKRKNSRIYCSISCKAMDRMKKTRKRNTNIENIIEDWLVTNNVIYEAQKIIPNVGVPDFFVYPNICIYADGDYWHSDAFPKTQIRDKIQTQKLLEKGYKVFRLKGSEILKGVRPYEILNNL